jgi:hypothetical protein
MILDSQVFAAALEEGDNGKPARNKKHDSKKNKKKKVIDKVRFDDT